MREILTATFSGVLLVVSISLMCGTIYGQEADMALFRAHPLAVNPSYTGDFSGDWRLNLGYRNQQVVTANPYNTTIAGFDAHFYIRNEKLGAGVYVMNDVSGIGGLTYNKIYASLGYSKDIANHIFSIGFQGGFVSASVNDWNNWNDVTGDFTSPSGESFDGKASYPDLNAGFSWKHKSKHLLPRAGISLNHLNSPNISFFNDTEKQPLQILVDAALTYDINEKIMFTPLMMAKIKSSSNVTITGLDLAYEFAGKKTVKKVFAGVYLNNGIIEKTTSVMLHFGAQVKRLEINVGYEQRTGIFGESTGTTGAFEIAVVYKSISTYLNTYSIPCERF